MTSQWPDNCEAITRIVISNLDIDFIYGDIHGRSCKKVELLITDLTVVGLTVLNISNDDVTV